MGTSNGVHEGSRVDVIRKFSTYDVVTEKLYQEVSFKVATLKVIHVESSLAVARLEKQATSDKTPVSPIRGVMLGDAVRLASGR